VNIGRGGKKEARNEYYYNLEAMKFEEDGT
jgi:hypothetical protein